MNKNWLFFLFLGLSVHFIDAQTDSKVIKHQMKVDEQCNNQELIFNDLETYHKNQVYNLTKDYKDGKLHLQFNIIESCCLKFSGESKTSRKGLEITYKTTQNEVCECFCKYQFTYTIFTRVKEPIKLYINEEYFEIKQ